MAGLFRRFAEGFILLCLLTCAVAAQTTSDVEGLSPPVRRITLLVDTKGENPPVYSGVSSAALPSTGEILEIQFFLPEAAGRQAFGYIIQFDDVDGRFSNHFTIEESKGWTTVLARDASGQENLKFLGLEAPLGAGGPSRHMTFARPVPVSVTGLLATFKLLTQQAPPRNEPLTFGFTAAIHSTTPPARLWHYRTRQSISWR